MSLHASLFDYVYFRYLCLTNIVFYAPLSGSVSWIYSALQIKIIVIIMLLMSFAIFRQAVGYSCLPKKKNEDGLVVVVFAKKMADVTSNQQAVVDTFQKLLGNKPNLTVCVDSVRELPSDKYVIMFIQTNLSFLKIDCHLMSTCLVSLRIVYL